MVEYTQNVDIRFAENGDIVMKLENEMNRDEATQ